MNGFRLNGAPWSSPGNNPVDAAHRVSEAGRSSGTHSHYTNGTVIYAVPAEETDRRTVTSDNTSLQFPGSARLPSSVRSEPLSFASPIPDNINTVIWPRESAGCYAVHDGSNGQPSAPDLPMFTPWVGSSSGARAWNAADKTEAAIPTKSEIWIATRLRRYLIGISSALYLIAAILLIVVRSLLRPTLVYFAKHD